MVLINIRQKTRKDTIVYQKKAYLCRLLKFKNLSNEEEIHMKANIKLFLSFLLTFCLLLFFGCQSGIMNEGSKEEDPVDRVIGRWKLNEVSVLKDEQRPPEVIDYSEENIIYEFQESHKLVVTGNAGDLFIFDDFKEGEHFYEYSEPDFTCLPGPNLSIEKPPLGKADGWYHCIVDLDNKTMGIVGNTVIGGVVDETGLMSGGNSYHWVKTFIKLN